MRDQDELFEEPGGVRPVPLRRAGIRHRLQALIFLGQTAGQRLGMPPHSLEAAAQIIRLRKFLIPTNAIHSYPPMKHQRRKLLFACAGGIIFLSSGDPLRAGGVAYGSWHPDPSGEAICAWRWCPALSPCSASFAAAAACIFI